MEVKKVLEVQEKMLHESAGKDEQYFRHFFTLMEKAQTLRLADRRDLALPVFEEAIAKAKTTEKPLAENWKCLTDLEEQVLTGQLAVEEFSNHTHQNHCDFQVPAPASQVRKGKTGETIENYFSENEYLTENQNGDLLQTIHPNPVSENGRIYLNNNSEKKDVTLEIYSILGVKLVEYTIPADQEAVWIETTKLS